MHRDRKLKAICLKIGIDQLKKWDRKMSRLWANWKKLGCYTAVFLSSTLPMTRQSPTQRGQRKKVLHGYRLRFWGRLQNDYVADEYKLWAFSSCSLNTGDISLFISVALRSDKATLSRSSTVTNNLHRRENKGHLMRWTLGLNIFNLKIGVYKEASFGGLRLYWGMLI